MQHFVILSGEFKDSDCQHYILSGIMRCVVRIDLCCRLRDFVFVLIISNVTDNAWKSNSLELWNLLIETQDQMIDSDRKDNRRH